jgi:hypothetical protein
MDSKAISEKEYEAISTMRDIAVILYAEISENLGRDSEYLSSAYNYLNGLAEMAGRDLFS